MHTETARYSSRHATLPPGFAVPGWFVPVAWLGIRSQTLRKLMVHWIPRIRLRAILMAWWWSWLVERFASGEVERVIATIDPDGEWETFGQLETYHGREGFIRMWAETTAHFGGGAFVELEEFIDVDAGGSRFVAAMRSKATANRSGLALEQLGQVCVVVTVAGGNAVRVQAYQSKVAALEAVGLA